ncbi:hypothetical protein KAT73_04560 [candidate division WOR-3 bacterium]|nr:hypothetical protein [candidate division WOR-3 bacterium]
MYRDPIPPRTSHFLLGRPGGFCSYSDHPSDGQGYPLSYRIKATVVGSGHTYTANMTQDNMSGLRQE